MTSACTLIAAKMFLFHYVGPPYWVIVTFLSLGSALLIVVVAVIIIIIVFCVQVISDTTPNLNTTNVREDRESNVTETMESISDHSSVQNELTLLRSKFFFWVYLLICISSASTWIIAYRILKLSEHINYQLLITHHIHNVHTV